MATLGFPSSVTSNVLYKRFPQVVIQQYNAGSGFVVTNVSPNEVDQLGGATKTLAPQDTWHAQYHFTLIKTRHKMKMGTDLQLLRLNVYNSQFSAGQYFFDRVYTQGPSPAQATSTGGHGFASFLLGVPIGGTMTFSPRLFLYQKYYGFYFQDDFRVTNKLTLNLGLRYEYLTPYAEKHGQMGYFDLDGIEPVTGGKGVFRILKPGEYQTDPARKKLGPHVGIAYQIDSKTVMRVAGAIFYAANNNINAASTDFGNGGFVSNFITLGPPNPTPFTPPVGGSWSNPFAGGFSYPDRTTTFPGQNIRMWVRKQPLAYVGNWSLSIQRALSPTLLVEGAYVGSKITHTFWNRQRNANDPLLLSQWGSRLLDRVPNPYFGKVPAGVLSFPHRREASTAEALPALSGGPHRPGPIRGLGVSEHDDAPREAVLPRRDAFGRLHPIEASFRSAGVRHLGGGPFQLVRPEIQPVA